MDKSQIILELEHRWVSREEIREMLGGIGDSAARSFITELNQELGAYDKCILSTSSRVGYHIGNFESDEDISVAAHALEELKAKAISIFERRKVIENFLRQAAVAKEQPKEVQGLLF